MVDKWGCCLCLIGCISVWSIIGAMALTYIRHDQR